MGNQNPTQEMQENSPFMLSDLMEATAAEPLDDDVDPLERIQQSFQENPLNFDEEEE